MNLVKLHIKENLNKSSFFIFAIIGILITAFVASSVSFSAPGVNTDSTYGQYAVSFTITNMIGALAAVTLSMGSFNKHLDSGLVDILRVHGKSLDKQTNDIIKADVLISLIMGLMLLIGMIINVFINRPEISIGGFLLAIVIFMLAIVMASLLMAVFNLIFAPAPAALFGVFFILVGSMREIFRFLVEMSGGTFGKVMSSIINIFPPISILGEIERDLFFGTYNDYKNLIAVLIYLWVLIGTLYLVKKWRVSREK